MNEKLLISNRTLPMDYGGAEMPKRIHIVPRGELFNREAGVTQILDDKALDSILADLKETKAKNGGLYLGEEHFIYNSSKSSEAFAWAKEFSLDEKGIWAENPEYTDVGAPAIKNKRFKWTSFVADPEAEGAVEAVGKNKVRIMKIDTVGFTNDANGKSLLSPITNRDEFRQGAGASGGQPKNPNQGKQMKTVLTELDLSADASEESALAAVRKLKNRVVALEPHETENKTLKNRVTALEDEQVAGILAERKVTDEKVVKRLTPMLKPLTNRADRLACLDELGFKGEQKREDKPATRILNRGGAGKTETVATGDTATEAQLHAEIRKIMNRDGIKDFTVGYNTLMAEKPELFTRGE